jgi:tetratricopeptide (TPR) repeat protein
MARVVIWVLPLLIASNAAAWQKDKPPAKAAAAAVDPMAEAEAKITAGDLDGAAALLRTAAAAPATAGAASLRLGRLHDMRSEFELAVDAYKVAGDKLTGPAKGEALARLAIAQQLRGMPEASATAQAALAADPEGAWPRLAQARLLAREGKGDEALALAQAAAAAGGPAASLSVGLAQEARGDLAAAEAAYRAAAADAEQKTAATIALARVLRKTSRAAEAEPMLKATLDAAPGAIEAHKESARLKMALGRASEAMGDAVTASVMAEGDAEAKTLVHETTVAKALEQIAAGQAELAVQDLTKLRDENPNLAVARVGLARALIARRQAEPALKELTEAIKLDPASADAHYQYGYVYHMLKRDAAAALPAYEKAVAADPGNIEYRTQLGGVLVAVNQLDRATTELSKVTAAPGYKRVDGWLYLGAAHVGGKRYKEAVAALEKAQSGAPDNVQVETYLAWSYFGLKDSPQFVAHAKKAASLGQKDPKLLEYLARVEKGEPIK